jgi:hypothetical protein
MENQHRMITGYRDLTAEEIGTINELKSQEAAMMEAFTIFESNADLNKRSLAIARTHLQTGYMWLIRALARPNGE